MAAIKRAIPWWSIPVNWFIGTPIHILNLLTANDTAQYYSETLWAVSSPLQSSYTVSKNPSLCITIPLQ